MVGVCERCGSSMACLLPPHSLPLCPGRARPPRLALQETQGLPREWQRHRNLNLRQRTACRAGLQTCQRCKQKFDPGNNQEGSCRYHPLLFTGGEISKAIGFVRQSSAPEDQVPAVLGRTGLIRFWDCCGATSPDDPGCTKGSHAAY